MFTYKNEMYKVVKFLDVNVYKFSIKNGNRFSVLFTTVLHQEFPTNSDYRQELIDRENQYSSARHGIFHLAPPAHPGESIPKEVFPLQPVKIWESDYCDISQIPLL